MADEQMLNTQENNSDPIHKHPVLSEFIRMADDPTCAGNLLDGIRHGVMREHPIISQVLSIVQ
jgi:hypothetical protein